LLAAVIGLGVLFFTLHSLPERLGHKKLQFEIVAVLGLLSLFTHIHLIWVAALLLALIDLPDLVTPLQRIARGVEKMSGTETPPDELPVLDTHRHAHGHAAPAQAPAAPVDPAGSTPDAAANSARA
jgi:hypothetical protein